MDVKLPMMYPQINSYAIYGNILSILGTDSRTLPWIYSNFIQLKCLPSEHKVFFNDKTLGMTPWIYYQRINRSLITGEITELMMHAIRSGYYIYLMVNDYYIPDSSSYQIVHNDHDLLIYGFNQEEDTFYIAGNFKGGQYRYSTCSYKDIRLSYYNHSNHNDWLEGVVLYSLYGKGAFELDNQLIKDSLADYLSSSTTKVIDRQDGAGKNYLYGISVLEHTRKYLVSLYDDMLDADVRPFHTIWDHKKCMVSRIHYLTETHQLKHSDILLQKFLKLEKMALRNRNLMIRYRLTEDKSIINKMIELIDIPFEQEATELMIDSIR